MKNEPVIVIPSYTGVHPSLQVEIYKSGLQCDILHGHSDLPKVRSAMLTSAVNNEVSRVIMVDSDTIVTAEALRYLADSPDVSPEQAVCGRYVLKNREQWSVNALDPENVPLGTGELFEVDKCGLGVLAVSIESLQRLASQLEPVTDENGAVWTPYCVPMLVKNQGLTRYLADDFSFIRRLRDSGTRVMCKVDIIAGHAMQTVLTEPLAQRG